MSKILIPTLKSVFCGKPQERWSEDLEKLCNEFMRSELNSGLRSKKEPTKLYYATSLSSQERTNIPPSVGERDTLQGVCRGRSGSPMSRGSEFESDLNWISRQVEKPLLDSNRRNGTRRSVWDRKQKRTYSGIMSGVYRYHKRDGAFLYHLTLTSRYEKSEDHILAEKAGLEVTHIASDAEIRAVQKSWKVFILRLRRELNEKIPFFKVITREGGGVIHAVMRTDCFRSWRYGNVYCYLQSLWRDIHSSPNIWFRKCFNSKKLARYVVSQYVAGNSFVHSGHSRCWCFRGFRQKFMEYVKRYHFPNCLRHWHSLLLSPDSFSFKKSKKPILKYLKP